MKRYIKFLFLTAPLALLGSCVKLDTVPYDRISSETFWQTPDHAKQAIMGVYGGLRRDDLYGKKCLHDNMGGLAFGWQESGYLSAMVGTANEQTAYISNFWRNQYDEIQRANQVIRRVPGMPIDDAIKKSVVAEAKFLRALHYAELISYFGGVPLYDEAVDLNADFNDLKNPRSTIEEVRAFIVKDLTEAIADLPVAWPQADYGRATKGAAFALRGKVYLYAKDWQKAIADFEEIVYNKSNSYGYALYPKYADLFKLTGHKSNEMIFSVQTLAGVGLEYGIPFAYYMGFRGSFGGGNFSIPTTELADSYENKDGSKFNWNDFIPKFNEDNAVKRKAFWATHTNGKLTSIPDTALLGKVYRSRDPRMTASLIVPYSYHIGFVANQVRTLQFVVAAGVSENFGQCRNNSGWYTYLWRKFVPEGNENGAMSVREHTPFNFPIIRYADVLLMLSEAYNEAGQLAKAIVELNKVRARVGMPGLNSGPAVLAITTKAQLFDRIVHERKVELAGEGHQFSDVRRWGIAKAQLDGIIIKNLFGETHFTRKFADRDYLWPIPFTDRQMNSSLTQNPGW